MDFLTYLLGPFPVGIWIVLVILLVCGGIFTTLGQALSLLSWNTAVRLRLQEDSQTSTDPVERTIGAMSQGEAIADVIVQGSLVVIAFAGILFRHPAGFVAGIAQGVIWVYVTLLVLAQRWMLFRWGVVNDRARLKHVALPMVLFAGMPGVLIIVCLIANREFIGW